jgi:hypothetical protein
VAGRVGRVAEGQGQAVGLRAGDAQVTTGVDHRVPGTLPQQGVDGAIHSVSLGNAAQVDPQGAVEAHPVVVEEFDVAPACVGIGVGSVGAGQGAVMHELRGHGGVGTPSDAAASCTAVSTDQVCGPTGVG